MRSSGGTFEAAVGWYDVVTAPRLNAKEAVVGVAARTPVATERVQRGIDVPCTSHHVRSVRITEKLPKGEG